MMLSYGRPKWSGPRRVGPGSTAAVRGKNWLEATEAVTLDAGGVLVLPSHRPVQAVLATLGLRLRPRVIDEAHYRAVADVDAAAHPDWETYLLGYLKACGAPNTSIGTAVEALDRALAPTSWLHCPSGARVALRRIARRYPRIAVVSNSTGVIATVLAHEKVRMCQVGDGRGTAVAAILDSGLVGVDKPGPAIFQAALTALDAEPARAMHVGDTKHADVLGAVGAGMQAVHIDPLGLCRRPCPAALHLSGLTQLSKVLP